MSRTGYNKPKLCLDCKKFIGYIRGNPKRCKDCAKLRIKTGLSTLKSI